MTSIDLQLREWDERQPEPGSPLADFSFDGDNARQAAAAVTEAGQLEFTEMRKGLLIRTSSYVGYLQIDRLNISVRPKLSGIPLAVLLRYAYGLRRLSIQFDTQPHLGEAGFQELMVQQLVAESRELLSRGLHRRYERQVLPLSSPRGRIDFTSLAKGSGPIGERLVCTDHPRSLNHIHNQVLKAGLALAAGITREPELRSQCRRLASMIGESVAAPRLDIATLRNLDRENNRLTTAYRPALKLIQLLRSGLGIDFEDGERSVPLPGFLFDMNRFFQTLISRFLADHLDGYRVRDEYGLRGMMEYRAGWNPNQRRAPTPRPDFLVLKGIRPVAMLDAKYRDLWRKPLPREMLYQLAVYALSGMVPECRATILYPTVDADATEARIDIRDPLTSKHLGDVLLRPVNLGRMAELIEAGTNLAARKARVELATQMALATQ